MNTIHMPLDSVFVSAFKITMFALVRLFPIMNGSLVAFQIHFGFEFFKALVTHVPFFLFLHHILQDVTLINVTLQFDSSRKHTFATLYCTFDSTL